MKAILGALTKLSLALLVIGTPFSGDRAFAQSPLKWINAQHFDTGIKSSVAVAPSSLVVEFHRSENTNSVVWYHIGRVKQAINGEYFVSWGESHTIGYSGDMPFVAVTREGYVLMVYTKHSFHGETVMHYFVGQLDPDGDTKQTITWHVKDAFFDNGQFARLAFNSNDVLVEAHESARNTGLFYRIGHFRSPATNDFTLVWDSGNGNGGVKYDEGYSPAISINDNNQVIECHRDATLAHRVHYRRGTIGVSAISFAGAKAAVYDTDASHPSVALTNTGEVVEAHIRNNYTFSRTGILNRDDSARVDWSNPVWIGWDGWRTIDPTIATNGTVAVATWASSNNLFYSIAPLKPRTSSHR